MLLSLSDSIARALDDTRHHDPIRVLLLDGCGFPR